MDKTYKYLLFFLFIFVASTIHIACNHFYFYYFDKSFYKMIFKIFLISLFFGTWVYIIRLYSFYFFGSDIHFIDVEMLYAFVFLLGSLLYVKFFIKDKMSTHTFIILTLVILLIFLNFLINFFQEK